MARTDETVAKPKNDAYTGMLAISFLALTVACVLLYLEYDSYGSTTPPASPNIDVPGVKASSAIAPRIEPAKPVVPAEEPKKEDPKEGEAPAKDAPAKDAPAKDAPAPAKDGKDGKGDSTRLMPNPIRLPDLPLIPLSETLPVVVPVKIELPVAEVPLPVGLPADLPPIDLKPFMPPK